MVMIKCPQPHNVGIESYKLSHARIGTAFILNQTTDSPTDQFMYGLLGPTNNINGRFYIKFSYYSNSRYYNSLKSCSQKHLLGGKTGY